MKYKIKDIFQKAYLVLKTKQYLIHQNRNM